MIRRNLMLLTAVVFGAACAESAGSIVDADCAAEAGDPAFAVAAGSKPLILRLLGSDERTTETVADPHDRIPGSDDEADCFTVPMWDVGQDRVVGTAKDCISVIGEANGGVKVVGTTTFDFGGGHSFTTQGLTSVQATTHGSPSVTHITGAIPGPASDNDVIAGSGRFAKLKAAARLLGAVNLGVPESAAFDCLFVISPM